MNFPLPELPTFLPKKIRRLIVHHQGNHVIRHRTGGEAEDNHARKRVNSQAQIMSDLPTWGTGMRNAVSLVRWMNSAQVRGPNV